MVQKMAITSPIPVFQGLSEEMLMGRVFSTLICSRPGQSPKTKNYRL